MPNKKEYGDFQTPMELAREVCTFLREEKGVKPHVVVEPTCGIGNFLCSSFVLDANEYIGIEINEEYCKKCLERVDRHGVRVIRGDIFKYNHPLNPQESVLVLGNPPWVTNSALGRMGSANLPIKHNKAGFRGIDAMTGKSNFDIAESIIIHFLESYAANPMILAMLCKMSVARKVFEYMERHDLGCSEFEMYEIDAAKYFKVHVAACLLYIRTGTAGFQVKSCPVYNFADRHSLKSSPDHGFRGKVSAISEHSIDGESCFRWRQGIKHDCSKVMELEQTDVGYVNGYHEELDIEEHVVFPLVKSSAFKTPVISQFKKYVIVTQQKLGEQTEHLQWDAPQAWNYLTNHEAYFNRRKSSIYSGAPTFSMFGIGSYAFQRYKVGISGFYKTPLFSLLYSEDGKPVMLDDTGYFLSFDNYDSAYVTMLYLNTPTVQNFLKSITYEDAKRPYTKKALSRVDFSKVTSCVSLAQLRKTEQELNLSPYCSEALVEKLRKDIRFSSAPLLSFAANSH